MNNNYPSLPSQPIRVYQGEAYLVQANQPIPQNVNIATNYNVTPVVPNKPREAYPHLNNAVSYPQIPQPTHAYPHHAQPAHHFNPPQQHAHYKQPQKVQAQPQAQNKPYIELTETLRYTQPYESYDNTREDSSMLSHERAMPGQLYPTLPSPMMQTVPQFGQFGNELSTPIVYDPSLLYKINSREPQLTVCQKCNKTVQTMVKYEIGTGTLVSSSILTFCGALPCAWIPCVTDSMKDAVHYCPACGESVGRKNLCC